MDYRLLSFFSGFPNRSFVAGDSISYTGKIHWVNKGKIYPLSHENLRLK